MSVDARVYTVMLASRLVGDYLYAWGGESPDEGGYDCSGYVSTVLTQTTRSWPELYDGARRTSRGIHAYYLDRGCPEITTVDELRPGCIVFYRRPGRAIHHVAIHAVTVPPMASGTRVGPISLEAGGGGSSTTSPRAALVRSAGVRISASDVHGSAEWAAVDPFVLLSNAA